MRILLIGQRKVKARFASRQMDVGVEDAFQDSPSGRHPGSSAGLSVEPRRPVFDACSPEIHASDFPLHRLSFLRAGMVGG